MAVRERAIATRWWMAAVGAAAFFVFGGVSAVIFFAGDNENCRQRHFSGVDSFVCVCDASYCDTYADSTSADGEAVIFVSSRDADRFRRYTAKGHQHNESHCQRVEQDALEPLLIKINTSTKYQTVLGFGGAFTDAVGINLKALSSAAADNLLNAYFGKTGIRYTIGRVPVASTDFSTRIYSYDDRVDDLTLEHFALASEDFDYKIPYIKRAAELAGGFQRLRLIATPWSAPGWMKASGVQTGYGDLKGPAPDGPYYRAYANYFLKFFKAYLREDIRFWALSIVNQPVLKPNAGEDPSKEFQSMHVSAETQRRFAYYVLAPTLRRASSEIGNLTIIAHDDNRDHLLDEAEVIYANEKEASVIGGLATHWYVRDVPYDCMDRVHEMATEKFLIATEACTGSLPGEHSPRMGDWSRAEMYANDTLNSLRHWSVGWIDWNLALDRRGGPNWVGNYVDAPIIVDAAADTFYKQPMYYALGHFSRFIPPGSRRISSETFHQCGDHSVQPSDHRSTLQSVAFLTPDGRHRVLVAINTHDVAERQLIVQDDGPTYYSINVAPHSIVTVIMG